MPLTIAQLLELDAGARNRFAGNAQFVPIADIPRASRVTARFFSLKDFDAVGDGVADDTAAWLACCAAADAVGGVVLITPGTYKITQGYVFRGGLNVSNKGVYIRGGGSHNTILAFHPTTLADNCIQFGDGTGNYFGGGVQDVQVLNAPRTGTGAGIFIHVTIGTDIRDTYVIGFGGTGGAGVRVSAQGQMNVQHLYLSNVYLQQCYRGLHGELGAACVAVNLRLTQNTYQGLNVVGSLLWLGGLLQESTPQPAATIGNLALPGAAANFTMLNVYVESATAYAFDVCAAAHVTFSNCTWQATEVVQTFARCTNSGGIVIEDIALMAGGHKFVESIASTGRVRSVVPTSPTAYSIDANSRWDFDGAGSFPSALQVQAPPASAAACLVLGAGLQLKSYTTTQRDAVTNVQAGTLIFNTTTTTVQVYTGSAWLSL